MRRSKKTVPAPISPQDDLFNLGVSISDLASIQAAIARQRERFDFERRQFKNTAVAMEADARRALHLIRSKVSAKESKYRDVGKTLDARLAVLATLNARIGEIEAKVAAAEAAMKEAEVQSERMRIARRELDEALATLRAYPTAKIEAWRKKRQALDPEALPRFTGVSG